MPTLVVPVLTTSMVAWMLQPIVSSVMPKPEKHFYLAFRRTTAVAAHSWDDEGFAARCLDQRD